MEITVTVRESAYPEPWMLDSIPELITEQTEAGSPLSLRLGNYEIELDSVTISK